MREVALCERLPFLLGLLRVSLGPTATQDMIVRYRDTTPSPGSEAEYVQRFIGHVRGQALPVPYIAEILDFEEALNAFSGTTGERVVTFSCDPALLFAALRDQQDPRMLPRERFRVAVAPHSIVVTKADGSAARRLTPGIAPSPRQ